MSQFEFVLVFLSIIVGLGVTALLSGIARQVQNRTNIRHYRVHSVLVAVVFTKSHLVHALIMPLILGMLILDIVLVNATL